MALKTSLVFLLLFTASIFSGFPNVELYNHHVISFNWAKLFLKQKTADILAFGVFGGLVQLRFVVAVLSRGNGCWVFSPKADDFYNQKTFLAKKCVVFLTLKNWGEGNVGVPI